MDFSTAREKMVDCQVRTVDVTDHEILSAMLEVPREAFVPQSLKLLSYIDEDLLVSEEGNPDPRYIMEPGAFAKLLQLADVGPDDVVLDVACGSGYSTAILSRLASSVVAIETNSELVRKATETLSEVGAHNAVVIEAPLTKGWEREGPYDVIIFEGAIEELPEIFFDQLKDGGRLVAVIGTGNAGVATIYTKDRGIVSSRKAFNSAIKPLNEFDKTEEFVF